MSKKLLKQMEFFDMMTTAKLTPNQYYILCSMRDSVSPLVVNLHLELRQLKSTGWIKETENAYALEPSAVVLIKQIEKLFKVQKKRTTDQLLGKDYKEKINQYREMFPACKLPSGSMARVAASNLENAFRWFFETNDYTWELVLNATALYINKYQANNWKYMRNSQYFIRKQEADRTFVSELANYCAILESGGDIENIPTFSAKVV